MKRYAIYCRVSTEEQGRAGHVSLEAQLHACRKYVRGQGGMIGCEEQDKQSGHTATRRGYQHVKEAAQRREIDAIIVWKLDRFGRNFREWINAVYELEQEVGVAVESVQDPNDPLTRNIMMSVAEQYLRDLSKHTINGLRYKARKGEWSGAPPLGYMIENKKLVLNPAIAPLVRRVFEEAASSKYSLAQLSARGKAAGLRGPSGHPISRQYLGRLLRNVTYVGTLAYGRQTNGKFARRGPRPKSDWIVTPNAHPALVGQDLFDRVQAVLTRHRTEQGTTRGTKFMLTSLLYCGRCAGTAGPRGEPKDWRLYGHGSKGRVYECSRRVMYGDCDLPPISARGFEASIKALMVAAFPALQGHRPGDEEALQRFVNEYESTVKAELAKRHDSAAAERRHLERQLEKHQRKRLELARRWLRLDGDPVPEDVYRALEREESEAIDMVQRALASLPTEESAEDFSLDMGYWKLATPDNFDNETWRELAVWNFERIIVHDNIMADDACDIKWRPTAEFVRLARAKLDAKFEEDVLERRVSAPAGSDRSRTG